MTAFAIASFVASSASIAIGIELRAGFEAAATPAVLGQTTITHAIPQTEQKLRICNAYASPEPLDIYNARTKRQLTAGAPLPYKQCRDFQVNLQEGDQLDFKSHHVDMGTFTATGLPTQQASLLLIPHRRAPSSIAMSFDSHAFASLDTAQVAVVDAYSGPQSGSVKIYSPTAREDLQYNSVVALNSGKYQLALMGGSGQNVTSLNFDVNPKETYVAMRVGVEDEHDASKAAAFPMELIVFPNSAHLGQLHILTSALVLVLLSWASFN